MMRAEIRWTGGPGGAGLTVLHFDGVVTTSIDELLGPVTNFAEGLALILPSQVTLQASNVVEVRAEATGALISTQSGAGQPATAGSIATPSIAGGVGARVRWPTAGIRNGRAVVGTTFVIPLPVGYYETNGTLTSGAITALTAAAGGLIGEANAGGFPLAVWSRPSSPGGSDGALHQVESVVIPDQVSWLRTRRS